MKFVSLIFVLLIMAQPAAFASYCDNERTLSAAQQLANLDPKIELDLVDVDLFPGGSVIAGYEYEVEPAYNNGLYSRTDSWQVGGKAIPRLSMGSRVRSSMGLGVQTKTEATFIRFFKDPCKAMLAKPYSPKRIPLTTEVALGEKFHVGDYFLFRGSLGFVASSEIFSMLGTSFWGVGLSGSYLIDGFYQMHIVRLDENHVRLKIIAHRGKGVAVEAGLGYENEFNVFSIERLNRRLERFVNTKPVKLRADINHAKVFMVDYVLDLTDPEVAAAYEEILPKAKDFKNLDLLGQFSKDLESSLLLDITPLEDIYRQDYQNGNVNRLKRNLKTTSDQMSYGFGVELGNKIVGFELNRSNSSANMSIPRDNDFIDRYILKSWDQKLENRLLYSWRRNKNDEGLRTLYRTDKEFKELEPLNVVRYITSKRNRFTYKQFADMKLILQKQLPREIYQEIPWDQWPQQPNQKFYNYGLRYELILAPELYLNAPELSVEEIKVLFKDHLLSKGVEAGDYFVGSPKSLEASDGVEFIPQVTFKFSLHQMAKLLNQALDKNRTVTERMNKINELRKNKLFYESGASFLMAFNPEQVKNWYHLDLDISSNQAAIDFTYGDSGISSLYKKIITIKAALDDDGLDLIREAESLSNSTARVELEDN